jgi:hypothetical protein
MAFSRVDRRIRLETIFQSAQPLNRALAHLAIKKKRQEAQAPWRLLFL